MKRRLLTVLALIMAFGIMVPAVLANTTVVVTENNVGDDWNENVAADGTVEFTDQFGAPAGLGDGALKLSTGSTNPSRAQLNTQIPAGTLLANIDDVGYWTYKSSASTGAQAQGPSINVAITDTGADGTGGSTTLVFEPIYTPGNGGNAAYGLNEWKSWDASGQARWWSTNAINGVCAHGCFVPLDDIKAANPDAVVLGIAVNLGTWNPDIVGATDGLTFGDITYDFEPAPPQPESKDDCKKGGWQDYGFKNQGQCIKFVNTGKDSR